ncbi:cytosine permease, partial [Pseudovibrio sp. POLY-S9]
MSDSTLGSTGNVVPDEFGIIHQELVGIDGDLYNEDQLPTAAVARTWNWVSISALWVGMVVCIPTYLLASYLIGAGMSWDQAVMTILLANAIVLIPMVLIGHAGTK